MKYVIGLAVMAAMTALGYQFGRVSACRKARQQADELHRVYAGLRAALDDARSQISRLRGDGVVADSTLPMRKGDMAQALANGELAVYYPREGTS